jgi:hypothetical protein
MPIAPTIPTIEADPTTNVISISIGENIPERICAQPRRYNQIAPISTSQKTKHGNAAHLVKAE